MEDYGSFYDRDGYVTVHSILSMQDIDHLREELRVVVAERRRGGLPSGLNVWLDSPAALRIATCPTITSIAMSLIGSVELRIWHDQAFCRAPASRGTPPHQDLPHWKL